MQIQEVTMALIRYRPLLTDPVNWMRPEIPARFGRVFDEVFGPAVAGEGMGWSPPINIVEADGELVLTAELPGMAKDEVTIDIAEGVLTLKGEKKEEKAEEHARYRLWERTYGAFERSFTLPRSVDAAKATAEFRDGILKVHLPQTKEATGRRLPINAR
jgi:HSP20 family protein